VIFGELVISSIFLLSWMVDMSSHQRRVAAVTDTTSIFGNNLEQPIRRLHLSQKIIMMAAWASAAVLAYATLTHVSFVYSIYHKLAPFLMRPARYYAHVEHVIAFAAFGALFSFAYPKRIFLFAA
jgi:hypothetical protein